MFKRELLFLCIILLVVACGLAETPTPQPTRRPTRTLVMQPTDTPQPTATAVPSPTPDPTAQLCPLTGIKDATRPWAARRPLVVKIDNSPLARPQSGLMSADLVIEHLAEGGVTRFDVVFYCGDADDVGPIRSARQVNLETVPMLQAILVNVGASDQVLGMLREAFGPRILDGDVDKPLFRRIKERQAPYNTYISTQVMWATAAQRGMQQGVQLKGLVFRDAPPTGGVPAGSMVIPYDKRFSDSIWDYVPERKMYKKFLLGEQLMDAASDQQVHASNVVVIFAQHTDTDIIEDVLGSRSIKIDLKGRGRAVVFRDGQAYEGQWVREDPNAMIRFVDANNQDIALRPGHSWLEVVRNDLKLEWK